MRIRIERSAGSSDATETKERKACMGRERTEAGAGKLEAVNGNFAPSLRS